MCLTLAVGQTAETYKAVMNDWLLLHENPTSEEMFTGKGFTAIANHLTNRILPSKVTDLAEYPLHKAVREGDVQQCQLLLRHVNAVDLRGWTPLHVAAASGQYDIIPLLSKAMANIDAFDNEDQSALILAIGNQDFEAVIKLHEAGANFNASRHTRGFGLSPLSAAALKGLEMVRLVLALGASPDKVDAGGWNPLQFAISAQSDDEIMIELSLKPKLT